MMLAGILAVATVCALFCSAFVAGISMGVAVEQGARPRLRWVGLGMSVAGCAGALASGVALGGMVVR